MYKANLGRLHAGWVCDLASDHHSFLLKSFYLVHLDKQIAQLEKRTSYSVHKQIPVRRLEKFAKVEEETLKYA